MKTVTASCGDVIQVSNIDAVGKVKEMIDVEPVYTKIYKWYICTGNKDVVIGYDFMFHTTGGCYYWKNFDTRHEAECARVALLYSIDVGD